MVAFDHHELSLLILMSEALTAQIKQHLAAVIDPYTQQSLTANKALKSLEISDSKVVLKLRKGYPVALASETLSQLIQQGYGRVG